MESTFYERYRLVILLAAIAAFPVVVIGAALANRTTENRARDWLPPGFEETKKFFWFYEHFGTDELLMVSWEGCDLNDTRSRADLDLLAKRLLEPEVLEDGSTRGPWFREVVTGASVASEFMDPPLRLSRNEALWRMEGWLVEKGARQKMLRSFAAQQAVRPDIPLSELKLPAVQTGLIALVSPAGQEDREAAVAYVQAMLDRTLPGRSKQAHIAGSTIESVAINEASSKSLPRLSTMSLIVVLLLMYAAFRHIGLGLIVFVIAVFCQQLSLTVIYLSGAHLDSIGLMVPTLVYVLVISAAVHLINYYRDATNELGGHRHAEARAVRYAWRPCFLAALTTALGLVSLSVSMLIPIRKFGLFASIGVMLGTGVLFLVGPALLCQFPPKRLQATSRSTTRKLEEFWRMVSHVVTRRHRLIAVGGLLALGLAAYGVSRIQPTARLHNLFPEDARVIRDYAWLEEKLGALIPVEIVIHIPKDAQVTTLEKAVFVAALNRHIQRVDAIDVTIRATNFMPTLPRMTGGLRQVVHWTAMERLLDSQSARLEDMRFLRETEDEQLWRIIARVKASNDTIDYGQVLEDLEEELAPVIAALQQGDLGELKRQDSVLPAVLTEAQLANFSGVQVTVCGSIPLVHKTQQQLLVDLFTSFLTAFAVIALVMVVLLRSLVAGLISMIPNLLPAILVFGVMGLLGIEIEVGSMMTASAALGIAVDDTLHFVTWFRRGVGQGMERRDAVSFAYHRCGTAMVQTSLICGLGMSVFVMSEFVPIARFAWLMAAMLAAALLADLVVLPAILVGPLGRFFVSRSGQNETRVAAGPS